MDDVAPEDRRTARQDNDAGSRPSPRPRAQQPAPRRPLVTLVATLAAVLVLVAAAAVYFGVRYHSVSTALTSQNAADSARVDALAAGSQYAMELSSYDYHDLDRGLDRKSVV